MKVKVTKYYDKKMIGQVFDLGEEVSGVEGVSTMVKVFKALVFKSKVYIPWLHIFSKNDMLLNFMNDKGQIAVHFEEVEEIK